MFRRIDAPAAGALVVLCTLAFALQGVASLAVDLPGCVDLGPSPEGPHPHAADDHPEGDHGLLVLPKMAGPGLVLTALPGARPQPTESPVLPLLQPPRAI